MPDCRGRLEEVASLAETKKDRIGEDRIQTTSMLLNECRRTFQAEESKVGDQWYQRQMIDQASKAVKFYHHPLQ